MTYKELIGHLTALVHELNGVETKNSLIVLLFQPDHPDNVMVASNLKSEEAIYKLVRMFLEDTVSVATIQESYKKDS